MTQEGKGKTKQSRVATLIERSLSPLAWEENQYSWSQTQPVTE